MVPPGDSAPEINRLTGKGWKMMLQVHSIQRKRHGSPSIRHNRLRDKKGNETDEHFIMLKETIHQEDITHYYICTQPGSTNLHKAITNRPKGRN